MIVARGALLAIVAFMIALTLADVDQVLGIGHRSALTHSIAPAALLAAVRRWRQVACGVSGGSALHLAADAFPHAMTGYATVKLPWLGALSAGGSYVWLGLNAVAAALLAIWLWRASFPPRLALALAAVAMIAGLAYLWRTDGGWAVLALLVAGVALWLWRRVAGHR